MLVVAECLLLSLWAPLGIPLAMRVACRFVGEGRCNHTATVAGPGLQGRCHYYAGRASLHTHTAGSEKSPFGCPCRPLPPPLPPGMQGQHKSCSQDIRVCKGCWLLYLHLKDPFFPNLRVERVESIDSH